MEWTPEQIAQLRTAAATGAKEIEMQMADGTRRRVQFQELSQILGALDRAEAATSTAPRRSLASTRRGWGRR